MHEWMNGRIDKRVSKQAMVLTQGRFAPRAPPSQDILAIFWDILTRHAMVVLLAFSGERLVLSDNLHRAAAPPPSRERVPPKCQQCRSWETLESSFLGLLNRALQTEWFKTTETESSTVEEARSPKSRCWQGWSPLEGLRRSQFPDSLVASAGGRESWVFLAHSCLPLWSLPLVFTQPPSQSVCFSPLPVRVPDVGFRVWLNDFILISYYNCKGPISE